MPRQIVDMREPKHFLPVTHTIKPLMHNALWSADITDTSMFNGESEFILKQR